MAEGPTTDRPPWIASLEGSEMAERCRSFDWAATSLGPTETWSRSLRTAVGICLTSRFPMLVVWGPDLVKIYNDGYRPILGEEKHPAALGAPAAEVWQEIWDVIEPMFRQVLETGTPTWSEHEQLILERNGFREECYFTWSYSPLPDDDGRIAGVLDVVRETTDEVVSRRRMALLAAVGAALLQAGDPADLCLRAASAIGAGAPDLPAVDLHLWVDEQPIRVASTRRGDGPDLTSIDLEALRAERGSVVLGRRDLGWGDDAAPADHVVVALGSGGSGIDGLLVASLNAGRPFDAAYTGFVAVLAQVIGAALDRTFHQAVEVGTYRQIGDTLQAAMLKPASDLPTVAARYLPAEGSLAVGGDWYDVIDLGGDRRALVVGDCVGHGLDAAASMSQLRSAARAMLLDGRGPAETVAGLDHFSGSVDGAFCATVAVAVIARADHAITYARAGHLPPLIVGADGHRRLDGAGGPPLGTIDGVVHREVTEELGDDEVLLLFSDGLVERRGEVIDEGLNRLGKAAEAAFGASVQELADHLLAELLPDGAQDDVVLVVKALPGLSGT
ncbi:MAG TPA: SpoIIE family protein phosphatase [Aquihabitans sp.]|nr:SpoIIE family protein phosphatase [Aquihabitans sp.]